MRNRITGAQSGAVTHHHDHVMTSVNFKMMKVIPSRPKKPIPPDEFVDVLILFLCMMVKKQHTQKNNIKILSACPGLRGEF